MHFDATTTILMNGMYGYMGEEKSLQKRLDRLVSCYIILIETQRNLKVTLSLLCKDRIMAARGLRNQSLVFF